MFKSFWLAAAISLAAIGLLAWAFVATSARDSATGDSTSADGSRAKDEPLVVYCAAGVKPPVEAAVNDYRKAYATRVELAFGGSGDLLSRMSVARSGDLFVAADTDYIEIGRAKGLIAESLPLATQTAVLAVPKGNPRGIKSIESLVAPDLRIALANPDAAAVGKEAKSILEQTGLWEQVRRAVETRGVFKPTVTDLANDLKLGAVDVAIVWDATVRQYAELEAIEINHELHSPQTVTIGVLRSSRQPARALHLARYLAARDAGLVAFEREGYKVVKGDRWQNRPALTLYIGGVLRPAVEQTIEEFRRREGVEVNTVYNGCGILVGQMKSGGLPDAYFACDRSFMAHVADVFYDPLDISRTSMVIAVTKGNPHGIGGLNDLQKAGLRIGVCNPQQSALGALTERMLRETGSLERVMENVVSQVPTADLLVAQLRAGGLDAAIVYQANYARVKDHLDAVSLGTAAAVAVQPVAVCTQSPYANLASRLVEALRTAASQKRFLASGFEWVGADRPVLLGSP